MIRVTQLNNPRMGFKIEITPIYPPQWDTSPIEELPRRARELKKLCETVEVAALDSLLPHIDRGVRIEGMPDEALPLEADAG